METRERKTRIRKTVFARRKEATPEQIAEGSHAICETICSLPEYQNSELILAYMDCKNEVQTTELIERSWELNKTVAVPRVEGEIMQFYVIRSYEDLEDGYFGIREPKDGLTLIEPTEGFLIIPGVGFDRDRHRIGYGKGFYDRYQAKYQTLTTCAICFEFQLFDEVPSEPTDICPQRLVTEKNMYV